MQATNILILILGLGAFAFFLGRGRSLALAKPLGGIRKLHSLPSYYGLHAALWCALPSLVLLFLWMMFDDPLINSIVVESVAADIAPKDTASYNLLLNKIANLADGILPRKGESAALIAAADHMSSLRVISRWALTALLLTLSLLGLLWGWSRISASFRARPVVEKVMQNILLGCACLAIFTTLGIVLSVMFESIQFFRSVPIFDFVFGLEWSPQTAIREDQVGSSGSFGAVPLFVGTLLVSAVAMFVAVPVGLMSAIYLAEYASKSVRTYAKPALEILAGIPTVVYGFFAALTVAPFLRDLGASFGLSVSSESASGRRRRHGGDDYSVYLLPSGRCDYRGAPVHARWLAGHGCYPVGNRTSGDYSRRTAGYRGWGYVGHLPRHWRNHDCGYGGGYGGKADR